ncbi:AMP-binding protein [Azospirillum sp. sgz302134]
MPPVSPDPVPTAPRPSGDGAGPRHAVAPAPDHRFDLHLAVAEGLEGWLTLTARQCAILYWAERGLPLDGIAERMGLDQGEVLEHLAPLAAAGAVHLQPSAPAASTADETLPGLWDAAVEAHAERPCLLPPGGGAALTYREAGRRVDAIARRLAAARLPKGARVVLYGEPDRDSALLFWACARLGLIVAPVDSAWGEAAFLKALDLVEPALVFADARRAAAARASGRAAVIVEGAARAVAEPPALGFADWLASGGPGEAPSEPVRETDAAVIVFTAGTTGEPKGVALSHGALVRSARLLAGVGALTAEDHLLTLTEFHAVSGLRNALVMAAVAGAATVLPTAGERHHAPALAALCGRERVTVLSAMPAALKGLAAGAGRIGPEAMPSVRLLMSNGAELPAATVERLRALTEAPVMTVYGQAEAGGVCALGAAGLAEGTIGRPADAVMQIVDPDGLPLPPGAVGELRVYGANRMIGHHRRPDLDARTLRDGWVCTGDRATRDEDGIIQLVGQPRDRLKTARGDRLHLSEIERLLERDPAVAEAAACALPDEEGGERALAFVLLKEGADPTAVVERLKHRALACLGHRAAPLDIRVRADFPRAANGMVRRRALLEEQEPDGQGHGPQGR